ncbi:unnamed protein product [Closterium sp. NIES-54]
MPRFSTRPPPTWTLSIRTTLCGTAWRDDYVRLHSAIRAASSAAYTPPPSPPPPPSSRRLLSLANSPSLQPPAAAAVPDPSLSNQALPASSVRFLTFDEHGHCGGFRDFLVGVVSSFVAALLDRRAFVIRHNCVQYAFEPTFIDWRPSPHVPMEPPHRTRNVKESFSPKEIPFLDLNNVRVDLQELARFKAFRHVKVLWNRGMLTETLTNGTGKWANALRATAGLRPPYAFGCILRFLVRYAPALHSGVLRCNAVTMQIFFSDFFSDFLGFKPLRVWLVTMQEMREMQEMQEM